MSGSKYSELHQDIRVSHSTCTHLFSESHSISFKMSEIFFPKGHRLNSHSNGDAIAREFPIHRFQGWAFSHRQYKGCVEARVLNAYQLRNFMRGSKNILIFIWNKPLGKAFVYWILQSLDEQIEFDNIANDFKEALDTLLQESISVIDRLVEK